MLGASNRTPSRKETSRMPKLRRQSTHAGSWYSNDGEKLADEIQKWIATVSRADEPSPRAIIAPHAGYRYSGHVMAYAYGHILAHQVSKVFLLGPSHHVYAQSCLLSPAAAYDTPLGKIDIDQEVYSTLMATGEFQAMSLRVDEAEHSLELHLPYIAFLMRNQSFTLVPIMVGALSADREAFYGRILAPYLKDPSNVFIISSDFCHWGSRFNFMFFDKAKGSIHDSIRWLDLEGIELIAKGDPAAFQEYLRCYSNTICGRHPIAVLLHALAASGMQVDIKLRKYDQSSRCTQPSESSVSYAAITVTPAS